MTRTMNYRQAKMNDRFDSARVPAFAGGSARPSPIFCPKAPARTLLFEHCYSTHTHSVTKYMLSEAASGRPNARQTHAKALFSAFLHAHALLRPFSFFLGVCHSGIRRPNRALKPSGSAQGEGPCAEVVGDVQRNKRNRPICPLRRQAGRLDLAGNANDPNGAAIEPFQGPMAPEMAERRRGPARTLAQALGTVLIAVSLSGCCLSPFWPQCSAAEGSRGAHGQR